MACRLKWSLIPIRNVVEGPLLGGVPAVALGPPLGLYKLIVVDAAIIVEVIILQDGVYQVLQFIITDLNTLLVGK